MSEQQTQQADDPSGPGWRWVMQGEALRHGDVQKIDGEWHPTIEAGYTCPRNHSYRRRIEPQQPSDSEPEIDHRQCVQALQQIAQLADTGSEAHKKRFCRNGAGDGIANGWRVAEAMREVANNVVGGLSLPQPSDSEPETMEQLRRRLAECEVLLVEGEISGQQVNAELQQLREQVQTLTQERDRLQSWLQQHHTTGQQSAIKKLERWLRPVVKVVSDHPDHSSILAVSVLEFLPQIASRLIEE